MKKIKWIKALTCICASMFATGTLVTVGAFADWGERSSNQFTPSDLFTQTSGFTLQANQDIPDYMRYGAVSKNGSVYTIDKNSKEDYLEDWETNGVKVTTTATNKKLYYSNVLDVNSLTAEEEMLVFSPIVGSQGASEITDMEVMLEDVEDPNCYVSIRLVENQWWVQGTAIRVSANGVTPVAYRWGDPLGELTSYGSERCYISYNGYTKDPGVTETMPVENFRHRAFKLHYDAATKSIYSTVHGGDKIPIVRLDDPHAVGYGNEWQGFTSGRVKLSIAVRSMKTTSASFMVFNVCGQELNGETVTDNTAPVMHFEKVSKETPKAEVGKPYPIYACTSEDLVYGAVDYTVTVQDPDGNAVAIENGCFTPEKTGVYSLTYSAMDGQNNKATKTFAITAQNGIEAISIITEQEENSFLVGDEIQLPKATLFGGAGSLSYSVEVKRVGGTAISVKNGCFVPTLSGEYLAVYTAVDYLGNKKTQTLSYFVEERVKPLIMPVQQFIKLFDGIAVDVPTPEAYDYTSVIGNKLKAVCEVTAQSADGSYAEKIENGVFTPTKEKFGNSVTFCYSVVCNGGVGEKEEFGYTVPLLDLPEQADGYFDFDKSIFGVQYNQGGEGGYLSFTTKTGVTGDQSLRFVNPVGAEGFELAFSIPANAKNFESFTIKLRDSVDASIGFDLEIRAMTSGPDASAKLFVRSGGVDYAMSGTFNQLVNGKEVASGTPLNLKYLNGKIIDYAKKTVLTPSVNFDGKEFLEFPSQKVFVEIEFNGVSGKAGITLTKLSTQTLGAIYTLAEEGGNIYYVATKFTDTIRPKIYLDEDIADEYKLGQKVVIPYARAYDALSPHVDVLVSVVAPNGDYLFKNQVARKDMFFDMTSYGPYTITFYAKDAAGRFQTETYTISAKDSLAPTLMVNSKDVLNMKVGSSVTLNELKAKAIIQDERDTSPQLYVMIIAPNYLMTVLTEQAPKYVFEKSGTYYIRWYAIDSNYNAIWKDVTVKVG